MNISEYKNEDAIELLADLIEPTANILSDSAIQDAFKADVNKMQLAKMCLKAHKKDVLEILAIVNGKTAETYTCNPITILKDLLAILNDKELVDFFVQQQAMMNTGDAPLFAVVNTEDAGL